jgi:hypothetical protein
MLRKICSTEDDAPSSTTPHEMCGVGVQGR